MRLLRATTLVLLAGAIGCGSDSSSVTPPPPPTQTEALGITIVSGDAQKGLFGATLGSPLVVSVTHANGTPAANVNVNWGVVAGDGTLSSGSSTTDQNGKA